MAIPNPSTTTGTTKLNTCCGAGSLRSHSIKVGNILMITTNKTTSRIIGKKLRTPINSFELRDIKKICKIKMIILSQVL